jgi:multisubunit Na+/H+ antiporter MnhB subunit
MTINSVTIKTTALYAFGFAMLVVLAMLVWTSAPDVALALYALADI